MLEFHTNKTIDLIVIAHDIRSTHNVGSLIRTAEALGAKKIIFSGYTPYPKEKLDSRLPYLADKIDSQINKTALGSQNYINWEHMDDIYSLIDKLKSDGYQVIGLEQDNNSINISNYKAADKIALILGREVEGIDESILDKCDDIVEIPLRGKKESLNVVQAAAIAIYCLVEAGN